MNYVGRRKSITFRDLCITGLATTEKPTFVNKFWASRAVNGTINTPAPNSDEFSALTIASTGSVVISA